MFGECTEDMEVSPEAAPCRREVTTFRKRVFSRKDASVPDCGPQPRGTHEGPCTRSRGREAGVGGRHRAPRPRSQAHVLQSGFWVLKLEPKPKAALWVRNVPSEEGRTFAAFAAGTRWGARARSDLLPASGYGRATGREHSVHPWRRPDADEAPRPGRGR